MRATMGNGRAFVKGMAPGANPWEPGATVEAAPHSQY
jgi:hypothetical protein